MAWMHPLFLLGAAALAGPLILHLLLRDRARRQVLPTLHFLPRAAQQSMARHRIKNLLLMLLRLAALALIVLGFARPYIKRPDAPDKPAATGEAAVFALDRSLSMRAAGRWDEAVNQAQALAGNMPAGSHFVLMPFDRTPRVTLGETGDPAAFEAALRELKPGMGGTDLVAAVRAAGETAAKFSAQRRRIYLLSDFQDTGFSQLSADLPLPAGVELTALRCGGKTGPNAAVTAMSEASPQEAEGGSGATRTIRVQATLYGDGPLSGELEILNDGHPLAVKPVTLSGNGVALVIPFTLPLQAQAAARLTAHLKVNDTLAEDNFYHLALREDKPLALVVSAPAGAVRLNPAAPAPEDAAQGTPEGINPYLKAAVLACGPAIAPRWVTPGEFTPDLAASAPVALVDGQGAPAGATPALLGYVRAGGVLIYFPGLDGAAALTELGGLAVDGVESLDPAAGTYRLVSSATAQGGLTLPGETSNALLGYPKALRYLKTHAGPGQQVQVLLQLDDGNPFLIERRLGRGAVYCFTAPLDPRCCDLVLRAAFSPFLFQLLRHAAHVTEPRTEYTVGELNPAAGGTPLTGPDRQSVAPGQPFPAAGWYAPTAAKTPQPPIIVRLEEKESDLHPMDAARIAALSRAGRGAPTSFTANGASLAPPALTEPDPDARERLWRTLLLATLGLLLTESLLASRTCR